MGNKKKKQIKLGKSSSHKNMELLFHCLWENSYDCIRLTDADGIIVAANKSYSKLVGSKIKNLAGKQFNTVYKEDAKSINSLRTYKERFAKKDFKNSFETKVTLKSGKVLHLDVVNTYINLKGFGGLVLSIFHDLTYREKAEQEKQEAEKFAALGKVAAYISHEIKTPLSTIKMNLEMLEQNLNNKANSRSFEIIQKEIKRLDNLIKNVLEVSRNFRLSKVTFNLYELFENLKELYMPVFNEKQITFHNEVEIKNYTGDYQRLKSAFMHLVQNSVEAINNMGMIKVYSKTINKKSAAIYVEDNGCGVENPDRIFEPFYTSKSAGAGIGLAVVQKIIEQHNGKISIISSAPGKTVFKIILPLS